MRLLALLALAAFACSHPHLVTRPDGPISSDLVIRRVRVFDSRAGKLLDGLLDVHVHDGAIAAVEPSIPVINGSAELKGGVLVPGLVDVHTHVGGSGAPPWASELPNSERALQAFLYCGVTTLLDTGNRSPAIFDLRADVAAGKLLGPRIFAAGPVFTAPDGHPAALLNATVPVIVRGYVVSHFTRQVGDAASARAAVAELAELKPDFVKVVIDRIPLEAPRIGDEALAAVVQEAHARGLRVLAHIGTSADVVAAASAGVDALIHGVYLEPLSDAALEAIASKHMPVAVTLSVFDMAEMLVNGTPRDFTALETDVSSAKARDALKGIPEGTAGAERIVPWLRALAAGHADRRANTAKLREKGVALLAGSDAANVGHFPGAGLHRELDLLVEAGLSPAEALRAATFENARFLAGDGADFGEIAPGKRGDLLLLDAESLDAPASLHAIKAVVKDGVVLTREARKSDE